MARFARIFSAQAPGLADKGMTSTKPSVKMHSGGTLSEIMHGNPAAREHLHNAAALVGAACGSVLDTVTTDLPNFPTNEERPTGDNDIRCANLAEQLGFHDCRAFLANCDALAML